MKKHEKFRQSSSICMGVLRKAKGNFSFGDFSSVCYRCWNYFAESVEQSGTFSNEVLLQMNAVFGQNLSAALDLIDHGLITQIVADVSNRELFQIRASSGPSSVIFIVLPSSWRCSCPSWTKGTWKNDQFVTCKHVLAMKLFEIINDSKTIRKETVTENTFIQMLAFMS